MSVYREDFVCIYKGHSFAQAFVIYGAAMSAIDEYAFEDKETTVSIQDHGSCVVVGIKKYIYDILGSDGKSSMILGI